MNKRSCQNCLYGDVCQAAQACESYVPVDEDRELDEYIENERRSFHKEWAKYTSQDSEMEGDILFHYINIIK